MFSLLMTWNIPLSLPSSEIGCSKSGILQLISPLHPCLSHTPLHYLTLRQNEICFAPRTKILAIKIKGKTHKERKKEEANTTINTKMPIEEKQRRFFLLVVGVFFFSLLRRQLTLWMNGGRMRKDQLMRRKENQKKSFQIHSVIDSAD